MIRWITELLGSVAWDEAPREEAIYLLDVRELVDKSGNLPELVRTKINEGTCRVKQGERVVVCCDYGMSRSNAIAAGILACAENIELDAAIRRVQERTGETSIKIEVLSAVRKALLRPNETPVNRTFVNNRVLVTGATGFIGTALLKRSANPFEPVPVARSSVDLLTGAVPLDMLAKESGATGLMHLANPRVYSTNQSMGETLSMLKNVLDVCQENGLRLVFLSGWEVYSGYRTQGLLAGEDLPLFPGGTYGQTKFLCERLIESYQRLYSLNVLILRPGPVYGPANDRPRFILNFLRKALRNEPIITHRFLNGFPAVDLLHVDDLVEALAIAASKHITGAVNLGSGVATVVPDLARQLVQRVKSNSTVQHIEIDSFASNVVMDIRRAKTTLGWRPKIALKSGLEDIVQRVLSTDLH